MKFIFSLLSILILLSIISCSPNKKLPTQYVDPLIGTDGHGHVYPGAASPFGMVQLSPDTRKDNWDACAGYHYSDSSIMGFSHTHLSGTGVGDYGDIRLMPTVGHLQLNPGTEQSPESGYRSRFNHQNEKASAAYYFVKLLDYDIDVELTASPRTGFHRYTFPSSIQSNIIIDLTEGATTDRIHDLWLEVVSDTEVQGFRRTQGWATDQYLYFNAVFSKPFTSHQLLLNQIAQDSSARIQGKDIKAGFVFATEKGEEIMVKVGISAVSAENAKLNRETEIPNWDFEEIKIKGIELWNNELGRIEVEDDDEEAKTIFYTALYHAMLNPNLYSDVNGQYRGHDLEIHQADGFDYYTVFSLWDTYRAEHPLLTIVDQNRTNDFIQTMLMQYEQGGLLPVWELAANETNCMIGYHAVPVIVDAYRKGIRNYDVQKAMEACVKSARQDQFGLKWYKSMGYIPSDKESESVSKTLEYAYDDWCISMMAKDLGNDSLADEFIQRAQYYKNVFDPESKFMRAKLHGTWFAPFDPSEVNFNYTEANSWQYSFYVPQDITGMMQSLGGADSLASRLDWLFTANSETTGRQQSDITGLIGQYAHGNEPSHHMAYLYNYCGQPWKTQEKVSQIMHELYTAKPDGLCGNEDCGQMSAWYVMSAMGFYAVTPGANTYVIGRPLFDKVTIHLENGKDFIIEAKKTAKTDAYIQSAKLNDKELKQSFFSHEDIMNGGKLSFEMGSKANTAWASKQGEMPVSSIAEKQITPVPYFANALKVFFDKQFISIACSDANAKIYYTIVGQDTSRNEYSHSIEITENTTIRAWAKAENAKVSFPIENTFIKIPEGRKVLEIKSPYANQYNAGGNIALIDFQRGTEDFRTGAWQGYEGVDLEVVVDLGKSQKLEKLSIGFFQDINAWIFMPEMVSYYASNDGVNFRLIGEVQNQVAADNWGAHIQDFALNFKPIQARYLKVMAKNRGECPADHKGAGSAAWIFADEIGIN